MLSQQEFWDWVENNIADALGHPVFSIGQEVLFERFGQIVVSEIESYVIGVIRFSQVYRD